MSSANQTPAGLDAARLDHIRDLMDEGVSAGVFPGAVTAMALEGEIVFQHAAGRQQDGPEAKSTMPVDAMFDLASVTKPMSGMALMLCIEDGLLTLDDHVAKYVPEYAVGDKASIRIRHLVSHTSGIQSNPKLYHEHEDWSTLLPAYLALPLVGQPGAMFLYSSINFIILALIVERVSGRKLDQLLAERVFKPLELDMTFNPPESLRHRIPATEYIARREAYDWGLVNDKTAQMMGGVSAHAGLFSSAGDLATIGAMLLDGGSRNGVRIMSPAAARVFTNAWTDERGARRGVCWLPGNAKVFGDLLGPQSLGHTGTTGTAMCLVASEKLVVVLLTNRVHPSRDNDLIEPFRPRFFNTVAAALTGTRS
ncbi:MAG: CubicO group peptidase beta-lactamase class family [Devosia sp.]|uniref:serine hydrolase domain-containing protein n=1 Tax=Devosia sp. TaxID=1871048 RepID=UPI0026167F2D|nr:serine hydrolase domain-containing protein [Devosia sp.]MDB5529897.1 CubicO group peptidase beta-lactamase class family [Devosia sp.]